MLGTFIRSIMLELADDILAVFLSTGIQRLLVWNWKAGYLITVRSTKDLNFYSFTDITIRILPFLATSSHQLPGISPSLAPALTF
jgi:ABC-type uncharacterized transport system involved in gliding motility auxiliary subunit